MLENFKKLSKRTAESVLRPLFLDRGGDHRDAIFVAGTERSGTTWLADLINYQKKFRFVFEPFWANKVPECSGFGAQQYIRPDDSSPSFLKPARKILNGAVRNEWSDKYHRAFVTNRRLVKDVRANLFLKWLRVQFPQMPIVLIVRHPCAVASSQEEARHRFGTLEQHFFGQPQLVEDFLAPFLGLAKELATPFEERVYRWCIQNYVPLRQFSDSEIHVIFYEELVVNPKDTLDALFGYLKLPLDVSRVDLLRPSPVSRSDSAVVTGESITDKWRKFVKPDEVERAIEILEPFGLNALYDSASMPYSDRLGEYMRVGI